MVDQFTKTKYFEQLKLEESQILEQFQKLRQMIYKSNLATKPKQELDSELDPVMDNLSILFNETRKSLDILDSNVGNIIEK